MACSTRDNLGYFESARTESYLDQHIFCELRGHSQNTKFLSDRNRHVFHSLCIYNQRNIEMYKEKLFVGSLNSIFLLNSLHLKCGELLHREQTTCFEVLQTCLFHFLHLSLLW